MKRVLLLGCVICNFCYAGGYASQCGRFEVGGDWLYWLPYQDNLEYGVHVTGVEDSNVEDIHSSVIAPRFQTSSGFKVYSDYVFSNCGWQVGAIYTNHYSSTKRRDSVDPNTLDSSFLELNSNTFPLFLAINQNEFTDLGSIWNTNYNCFDLDVSRKLSVCTNFGITLHSGLRGMWIRQKLHVDGVTPLGGSASFVALFKQQFEGYGLEAGITADWVIGCNFSLTAQLGTSLLYSRIKIEESLNVIIGERAAFLNVDSRDTIWHLSPTLDGFLGLQYRANFRNFGFNAHVGWEQHLIMSFNRFGITNITNYSVQGLTLGGGVTF